MRGKIIVRKMQVKSDEMQWEDMGISGKISKGQAFSFCIVVEKRLRRPEDFCVFVDLDKTFNRVIRKQL